MRLELKQIARVDLYLDDKLSPEQRDRFEKEIKTNQELKNLMQQVEDVRIAAHRAGLRNQIESLQSGGPNWWKLGGGGLAILLLASLFFWMNPTPQESVQPFIQSETEITEEAPINMTESVLTIFEANVKQENQTLDLVEEGETSIESHPEEKYPYQLGGLNMWASPAIQNFRFNSEEGATIEGKEGTLIIVPNDAFIDSVGNPSTGEVHLELVEAFNPSDFVLMRLKTVSNGNPLSSGGMLYLKASIEGNEVQVNPKRPFYIEVPALEPKADMKVFEGNTDSLGNINWGNPQELKKYLVKVNFDELDFLPSRFEPEVGARLPFRKIPKTKPSIDSLYHNMAYITADNLDINRSKNDRRSIIEPLAIGGFNLRSREAIFPGLDTVEQVEITEEAVQESEASNCGILPSTVKVIKSKKFVDTYIATQEFESRIKELHELDNGEELLAIYLDNLKRDMSWSDSVVASKLNGSAKQKFEAFASLEHGNIKYPKVYQKRLSEYYRTKRDQLNSRNQKLANNIRKRNKAELNKIRTDLANSSDKFLNRYTRNFPEPSAATSNTYSFPWFKMGWVNIDSYLKLLQDGSKEVEILVQASSRALEVSQYIRQANTYVDLNRVNQRIVAAFPVKNKDYRETNVFAISYNNEDETYLWGSRHYNPYSTDQVELKVEERSIQEIKRELQDLDVQWGTFQNRLEWKKKQINQLIKQQQRADELKAKWIVKQRKLVKSYRKKQQEQEEARLFVENMKQAAFPCYKIESVVTDAEIMEY